MINTLLRSGSHCSTSFQKNYGKNYLKILVVFSLKQPQENKKIAVTIDSELYQQLQKMIEGTGFSSVDDYVVYLLRSHIGKKSEGLSEEDTEAVTSRLKSLGYL